MSGTSSGGGANIILWAEATDSSGLPHRTGLRGEDVFELVPWQLPVNPSTPIPVEITRFLVVCDIYSSPGVTLYNKPSFFPCQPLPDPECDDSESQSRTTSTDSSLYNFSVDLNRGREADVFDFSGDDFDSKLDINVPDEDAILDDIPTEGNVEDKIKEQAEESDEDQDEDGEESDENDIDDDTTFPIFEPFLGLI